MEAKGEIGSVGSYDAKLVAGVAEISVGVKYDIAGELQKLVDAKPEMNAFEKAAIGVVIGILRGLS